MKRFIKDEQGEAFVLRSRALYERKNPGVVSGWQNFAEYTVQRKKIVMEEWRDWRIAEARSRGEIYE